MAPTVLRESEPLILESRHTGEILKLRRVRRGTEVWIEIKGSLPAGQPGPPLHRHHVEVEEGRVMSGTLAFVVDGVEGKAGVGEAGVFPRGSAHTWWNGGKDTLVFEGYAKPAADLDRYLQAVFEVVNSSPSPRPPLFYLAHAVLRHSATQELLLMPRPLQTLIFRMIVALGTVLGRYRGTDWPGCPARCPGAPLATDEEIRH
jgi:mannose-6-phosphate isomerase-like protein (cupin superfamily)